MVCCRLILPGVEQRECGIVVGCFANGLSRVGASRRKPASKLELGACRIRLLVSRKKQFAMNQVRVCSHLRNLLRLEKSQSACYLPEAFGLMHSKANVSIAQRESDMLRKSTFLGFTRDESTVRSIKCI